MPCGGSDARARVLTRVLPPPFRMLFEGGRSYRVNLLGHEACSIGSSPTPGCESRSPEEFLHGKSFPAARGQPVEPPAADRPVLLASSQSATVNWVLRSHSLPPRRTHRVNGTRLAACAGDRETLPRIWFRVAGKEESSTWERPVAAVVPSFGCSTISAALGAGVSAAGAVPCSSSRSRTVDAVPSRSSTFHGPRFMVLAKGLRRPFRPSRPFSRF